MKRVGLVVGHRKSRKGAYCEKYDIWEWDFVKSLVEDVADEVLNNKPVIIFRDDVSNGYSLLPGKVNDEEVDIAISFHANANESPLARGTAVLYWHSSSKSKALAQKFQNAMLDVLGLQNDGIMPIYDGDRGSHVLKKTKMPCVLLEPFYLSNDNDYDVFHNKYEEFVEKLAEIISSL